MTKQRKTKEVMVQSTMRIPRTLWQRINKIADMKRLSMAQTVERALFSYCYINRGLPFDFEESFDETDWRLAENELKSSETRRRAEQKRRRGKR